MVAIRLTAEERARLEADAGGLPFGEYIRGRLFGARKQASRSQVSAPDRRLLAEALAKLGKRGWGPDLTTLARTASAGALTLTPEVEAALLETMEEVREVKSLLMGALGVGEPSL